MSKNEQSLATAPQAELIQSPDGVRQSSVIGPARESPRQSPQPPRTSQSGVVLHIEELVLHGFEPAQRYRVGAMIESELARLFAENGAPGAVTRDVEIPHLNCGAFTLEQGSNSEVVAVQLARTIYRGLGK